MLVLTRLKEEGIMIGDDIEVRVLEIRGDRVRLGIVAPMEVAIHRKEIYLAIQKENVKAAEANSDGVDAAFGVLEKKTVQPVDIRKDPSPDDRATSHDDDTSAHRG